MKKVSALVLAVLTVLALTLTACDFNKIERASVNPDTDISQPLDLSIQLPYVSDNMGANPVIPLIEELTGYKCTYTQFPSGTLAETELEGFFAKKPNTYHAVKLTKNQFNKKAVLQAGVADITDIVNSPRFATLKNSIKQEAWDAVTFEGKILGIPDSASNNNIDKSIIIRKDLMYKLKNPDTGEFYTEVPDTFDGFVKLLKTFKTSTGSNTALSLPQNMQFVPAIAASFGIEQLWQNINGELVFAAENPNLESYLDAMQSLKEDGLLDASMQTNTFATCSSRFAKGEAIATVSNFWEMATVSYDLKAKSKNRDDCVAFATAFKNKDGKLKTWQSGGCTYVTVIPNWMANTGAYVLDYIQKKVTEENFVKIVAGTLGTDYLYDEIKEEFYPLEGFSDKKLSADHFVTGTNDNVYNTYWTQVVVKGVNDYYFQWKATNADAFKKGLTGVMSPIAFAPPFKTFSASAAGIEDELMSTVTRAIFGSGNESAATIKSKYLSKDNEKAVKEIKNWYSEKNK